MSAADDKAAAGIPAATPEQVAGHSTAALRLFVDHPDLTEANRELARAELERRAARQADRGYQQPNAQVQQWGPRPPVKGTRKHCSTHAERREDCYRCQTEGCF